MAGVRSVKAAWRSVSFKNFCARPPAFSKADTLHSNNLYQIFTYVKNREYQFGDEENKVSGMLLYARTDALIQPDNVYQMHGNQISVKTLDLNKPFDEIAKQLDEIAAAHFDGIEKTI